MVYNKIFVPADGAASYVAVAPRSPAFAVIEAVTNIAGVVMRKFAFEKTVAELAKLDDQVLKDIGVDRGHIPWVAQEAVKNIGVKRFY